MATRNVRGIILDLCGTLYVAEELSLAYKNKLAEAVASKYQLSHAKAQDLILEAKTQYEIRLGYQPSTLYLSIHFGVKQEYMQVTQTVDPLLYISPSEDLRRMIHNLARNYILAILTHSTLTNTKRVLNIFGISECFRVMVTAESVIHPKPHLQPFQTTLKELCLEPQACCMVGDRANIDLAPAKCLGMKTILVGVGPRPKPAFVDFVVENVFEILSGLGELEEPKSKVYP